MSATGSACIYCTTPTEPTRGEGDHVLPAAFGRFHGQFVFRRICRACNNRIGASEEQLLRCAPDAYFRRLVQPAVKRRRRGFGWVGANGSPPPKFTIDRGDHFELADASDDDPRNVRAVDQLVVIDRDGREHHVRLFPEMTAGQLRAKVTALSLTPGPRSYLHADAAAWPGYVRLLGEVWPESPVLSDGTTEAGVHKVRGRTHFRFTADYWRALAKIAFHYYLVHSRRGLRGDEPEFADVRRFVLEGGDHTPFFDGSAPRFAFPSRELGGNEALLSSVWAHLLAADETFDTAVVAVHLFTGPQRLPPVHHVTLGRFRTPLVVPRARWAHAYVYDPALSADGYAGRVEPVTLIRLR